jgi:hypothetical protein
MFSLRWSISLVLDPVVNLLFFDLIERDSRSIFIKFNIIAASCWIIRSITTVFRWSIYFNWYILLVTPVFRCPASAFRWSVCHAGAFCLPVRSVSLISRWSFWRSASVSRWFNCIIASVSYWFICFAALAFCQSARSIVFVSYGFICFSKSVSYWSIFL